MENPDTKLTKVFRFLNTLGASLERDFLCNTGLLSQALSMVSNPFQP